MALKVNTGAVVRGVAVAAVLVAGTSVSQAGGLLGLGKWSSFLSTPTYSAGAGNLGNRFAALRMGSTASVNSSAGCWGGALLCNRAQKYDKFYSAILGRPVSAFSRIFCSLFG